MSMPKMIWAIDDCCFENANVWWDEKHYDHSTKYHSEAALLEMLEGMKREMVHLGRVDLGTTESNMVRNTYSRAWNAAIDAVIEKIKEMR